MRLRSALYAPRLVTYAPGTRLGPYEVLAPLGAGAMGQVYRARDPRLDREVAIKVLPPEFAADAERLRRFTQEAQAAGSLQHPNIVTVFDVGSESGTPYVVQELVAGGTLGDRLARGPVPMRQALSLAAGIASGLAAAHEKGVVHRDLKPANVALASDGRPQVLDFGLARVTRAEGDATMAMGSTAAGVVLGTVGYMAPEQVRGERSDARSDLFALGVILHEMLSGARPFERGSAFETMHAILTDEPPPLPPTLPSAVSRVVARCLEKDADRRFQSARDVAFTLEALGGDGSRADLEAVSGPVGTGPRARFGSPWVLAAFTLIGALGGFGLARLTTPAGDGSTIRVSTLSHGNRDGEPAVSPDGRLVAFSAVRPSGRGIWVMDMVSRGEVKLTDGADNLPRFAPDGSSILFSREDAGRRSLWRVPVLGGSPRLLIENATDADPSPDGSRIVFLRAWSDTTGQHVQLLVSRSDGTEVRELLSRPADLLFGPRWSPDGDRVVVIRAGNQNVPNAVLVVSARDGSVREYPAPNGAVLSNACWEGNGRGLVVVEGEGLLAVQRGSSGRLYRLDLRSGAYRSLGWLNDFAPLFDILPDGRLVLSSNAVRENLLEVAADGRTPRRWLTHGMGIDRQPVYSPDGQWVMFSSNRGGTLDLWEVSVQTGELRRITDDPADDWDPVYSRDGRSIFWSSNRTGAFEIWTARRDGSEPRQVSRDSVDAENPSPTPDGRWVIYSSARPGEIGIWRVPTEGGSGELLFRAGTLVPELSPDGRHLAMIVGVGTLAGHLEVLDLETRKLLPSSVPLPLNPGLALTGRSRWTPDGRALIFLQMSADGGMRLLRRPLESWTAGGGVPDTLPGTEDVESFAISPDGRRIAVATMDWLSGLTIADGVRGIVPPRLGARRDSK